MDALNKAEQAKRQSQATDADAANAGATSSTLSLELTPLATAVAAADPAAKPAATEAPPALPELPTDLEILDQEFIAHAATSKPASKEKKPQHPAPAEIHSAPPRAAAPAPAAISQQASVEERAAAQNLFAAKQPRPPTSRKTFAIVIGLLTLLAGIGIGGYFWLQLHPNSGLHLSAPLATAPLATAPVPPAAAPTPQLATPAQSTVPAKIDAPPQPPSAPMRPAAAPAATAAVEADATDRAPSPIRITTAKLVLNPALARGYAAYLAGDLTAASNEYRQVLESEAKNIDALHGMAAISLRLGQADIAVEYYLRAIEADPKDALAQAGLIGLKGQADPSQAETRLKILLAAQPDLPFLNFTLGNLYASQKRWNEAQSAFFKAYRDEPENPDIVFNLAVSLDQLHQPQLARQYYLQALSAAAKRPASFDQAQVGARLRELQQ